MPQLPISVIIPALNAEPFIGEAIESVLGQTVGVSEIIVVDNGCSDRTAELARGLGAMVVDKKDRSGVSIARNEGIRSSNYEWMAFLDADDQWHRQKIERQWSAVEACPEAALVSCDVMGLESNTTTWEDQPRDLESRWMGYRGRILRGPHCSYFPRVEKDFFLRFQLLPSAVMLRRKVFSVVGMFDEEILFCEDLEFFMRALARFPLAIVEQSLTHHRRHQTNRSHNLEKMRSGIFSVVNTMLKHRENYPPGAPEAYRDLLKKHFVMSESALLDKSLGLLRR